MFKMTDGNPSLGLKFREIVEPTFPCGLKGCKGTNHYMNNYTLDGINVGPKPGHHRILFNYQCDTCRVKCRLVEVYSEMIDKLLTKPNSEQN